MTWLVAEWGEPVERVTQTTVALDGASYVVTVTEHFNGLVRAEAPMVIPRRGSRDPAVRKAGGVRAWRARDRELRTRVVELVAGCVAVTGATVVLRCIEGLTVGASGRKL